MRVWERERTDGRAAAAAGGRDGGVRRRRAQVRAPPGVVREWALVRAWGLVGDRGWEWACEWAWYVSEASCGTRCARGTGQARAVMHDGHAGRQLEARLGGLVTRTAGRGNRAVVGGEGAAEVGGVGAVLRDGAEKWTPGAASARGRGACAVWCGGAEK